MYLKLKVLTSIYIFIKMKLTAFITASNREFYESQNNINMKMIMQF